MGHLLSLPPGVPYAVNVRDGDPTPKTMVHVLPCLSPADAAQIRADAEKAAERLGGWAPRAVGCCTNDVLVNQLPIASQQLIFNTFRRILMPYATKHFPRCSNDSLRRSVECFFIIKYKAGKSREAFGEHTDHTKITINLSLTEPGKDFGAGGLFFPCATAEPVAAAGKGGAAAKAKEGGASASKNVCGGVVDAINTARAAASGGAKTPASQSTGLVLRVPAGTAVIHNGDIRHAGEKIDAGERLQLVAFFYGSERRGNALPMALETAAHTAHDAAASRTTADTASQSRGGTGSTGGSGAASQRTLKPPPAGFPPPPTGMPRAGSPTPHQQATKPNLVPNEPVANEPRRMGLADIRAMCQP